MAFRLMLNLAIRDNYAFCDLDAPLVMNLSNPSGTSTRITTSILRGLRANTIIDLDKAIDLETGDFVKVEKKEEIKPEVKVEEVIAPKESDNADKEVEVKTDEAKVEEPAKEVKAPFTKEKSKRVAAPKSKVEYKK